MKKFFVDCYIKKQENEKKFIFKSWLLFKRNKHRWYWNKYWLKDDNKIIF